MVNVLDAGLLLIGAVFFFLSVTLSFPFNDDLRPARTLCYWVSFASGLCLMLLTLVSGADYLAEGRSEEAVLLIVRANYIGGFVMALPLIISSGVMALPGKKKKQEP
jgi:hypothetical protein